MSRSTHPPLFIVIAGPNGAGKTTFYQDQLRGTPRVGEFVNADLLAMEHFGHTAATKAESEVGQQLAEERRRQLMAERKPLVTESTFSHPSKVDLVRDAKAAGYVVHLYHVNIRSAELAVMRVSSRVSRGGHDVPVDKTRDRYERNPPLIREAALLADKAFVIDNSKFNAPHRLTIELRHGQTHAVDNPPPWARALYANELAHLTPTQVNSPAASYDAAKALTLKLLGDHAETLIVRNNSTRFTGAIIGHTAMHVVQQTGPRSAVTHFSSRLDRIPDVGESVRIQYQGVGRATVEALKEKTPAGVARATSFLNDKPADAVKKYPELASAFGALHAVSLKTASIGPENQKRVIAAFRQLLVDRIERGDKLPPLEELAKVTARSRDRSR